MSFKIMKPKNLNNFKRLYYKTDKEQIIQIMHHLNIKYLLSLYKKAIHAQHATLAGALDYPPTVDMKPAYNGINMEPEYLPAKYPHVLFKPTYAMGFGLMSSIPTYNFTEVCEFVINLIEDPTYDRILYPDLPTGCDVIDDGQFDEIRRTGEGKFRMKAKVNVDEENNIISISAMPLMTNLNAIIKPKDGKGKQDSKIISLVKSGDLTGYKDIHDKSTFQTAGIDILFKEGTDLYANLSVLL